MSHSQTVLTDFSTENNTPVTALFEKACDWDTARVHEIEKSERRAWTVSFFSVLVAVLSWITVMVVMPLKETIPYLIRVDNVTGVPDIVTMLKDKSVDYNDVMDKFWLATYVRAHETYDWYTLQDDYEKVGILSSAPVADHYLQQFKGSDALDKKYGNNVKIATDVLSVVPTGNGNATVRFIKRIRFKDGLEQTSKWIATLAYVYRNPSKMKERLRLINPLGFQVLSYRIDPELIEEGKKP